MKLAVFADIHGSLPALEAALAETEREGVDGYIVAGDMLAGPNPAEVMDRLRTLKCWMIRGNQEDYILRYYNGSAPAYWYHSKQWAWMHWNYQRLDQETLAFISTLPDQRSLQFPGTDTIKVALPVLSSCTISAPPCAVRSLICSTSSALSISVIGIPATVE